MNEELSPKANGQPQSTSHGRDAHATSEVHAAVNANPAPITTRQGAYLPHWTRDSAIYSVTFRLADALPQHILIQWLTERDALRTAARKQNRELTPHEVRRLRELHSENIEKYLDAGKGACWMHNPDIAKMVADSVTHFDGQRYLLHAWCVMPNHVHTVVEPFGAYPLDTILHSEPYDHILRDLDDYQHVIDYVLSNPANAGLSNWPWSARGTGIAPTSNSDPRFPPT